MTKVYKIQEVTCGTAAVLEKLSEMKYVEYACCRLRNGNIMLTVEFPSADEDEIDDLMNYLD